ncbi:DNA glycosylase AlkZ-like family protein [Amycolatopsis sp. PS_44_ISF1]|uniref:DNA glycosylase AlkZ-like family protein n=1 Tax=Amycolatopsis sp. PS_44_ISF1 TaxID=2974917 RepID=UPI0028DD60E0|nr:crosslink repair DNA glycosylase YcaQ family protein [Amycolatopsis sp. PS_44_ISF1]MDT8909377.1 winged helix DNA-binding domain-containing protein [Amycolatopsis sp. PS_44_ISF1]
MLEVSRQQVLAYRVAEHGLHRRAGEPAAVFDLGLQDSLRDTALLALAARSAVPVRPTTLIEDPRLALVWSHRGAPHFHRRADLPELAASLVPLGEADALSRILWRQKELSATGLSAVDVLFTTARALRQVVTATMTKGAASAAVTKLLPDSFSYACRGCRATHVYEQLMRVAALPGGIRLAAGRSPATLAPLEDRGRFSTRADPSAAARVLERYLRLNGPATPADAAAFAGTTKAVATQNWPADLVEVRVDGRRAFLPADRIAALENPPSPSPVRLLPPLDPFTQARDKAVLVPDQAYAKEIWKVLGSPGALLVDGELHGTWRAKATGARLNLTITPFTPCSRATRTAAEDEAALVATARGYDQHAVTWA